MATNSSAWRSVPEVLADGLVRLPTDDFWDFQMKLSPPDTLARNRFGMPMVAGGAADSYTPKESPSGLAS